MADIKQIVLLISLFLVLIQAVHERDEYRIFNRNIKLTTPQIKMLLAQADLENKGYSKEVTKRVITNKDMAKQIITEYYIYKSVACNNLVRVQLQLAKLLPGIWGNDITNRTRQLATRKSISPTKQCTVGIEIHFPQSACQTRPINQGDEPYHQRSYSQPSKRAVNDCHIWCIVCLKTITEN